MEKFPNLENAEVAVIRADSLTGHILDENLTLALTDHQKVYTIFDNIQLAKRYIEERLAKKMNIEFVVYGQNRAVLIFYPAII